MLLVLNESCARQAHDELKAMGHREDAETSHGFFHAILSIHSLHNFNSNII